MQLEFNLEAMEKACNELAANVDESMTATKNFDIMATSLCEKNDAPALKRGTDGMVDTLNAFGKMISEEVETVKSIIKKAFELKAASE